MFLALNVILLDFSRIHTWDLIYYTIHHFYILLVNSLKLSLFRHIIQTLWSNLLCLRSIRTIMTNRWPFTFTNVKQFVQKDLIWFSDLNYFLCIVILPYHFPQIRDSLACYSVYATWASQHPRLSVIPDSLSSLVTVSLCVFRSCYWLVLGVTRDGQALQWCCSQGITRAPSLGSNARWVTSLSY